MLTSDGKLSRTGLRILAAVFMIMNHAGHMFCPEGSVLRSVLIGLGCFTAPLMCRALVDGWQYTSSKKNYILRLLVFGLISEVPYLFAFGYPTPFMPAGLNFILTLTLGALYLYFSDYFTGSIYIRPVLFLFIGISYFFDWGFLAPLFILFFLNSQTDLTKEKCVWWFSAVLTAIASWEDGPVCMAASFAGVALAGLVRTLWSDNTKSGSEAGRSLPAKYGFYLFYPLHLAVLAAIRFSMG